MTTKRASLRPTPKSPFLAANEKPLAQMARPFSSRGDAVTTIVGKQLERSLAPSTAEPSLGTFDQARDAFDQANDAFDLGTVGTLIDGSSSRFDPTKAPAIPTRDGGVTSRAPEGNGGFGTQLSGDVGAALTRGHRTFDRAPVRDEQSATALPESLEDADPNSGVAVLSSPSEGTLGARLSDGAVETVIEVLGVVKGAAKMLADRTKIITTLGEEAATFGSGAAEVAAIGGAAAAVGAVAGAATTGYSAGKLIDRGLTAVLGQSLGGWISDRVNGKTTGPLKQSPDMNRVDPLGGALPAPLRDAENRLIEQRVSSTTTWKVRPTGDSAPQETSSAPKLSVGDRLGHRVTTGVRDDAAAAALIAARSKVVHASKVDPPQPESGSASAEGPQKAPSPPRSQGR